MERSSDDNCRGSFCFVVPFQFSEHGEGRESGFSGVKSELWNFADLNSNHDITLCTYPLSDLWQVMKPGCLILKITYLKVLPGLIKAYKVLSTVPGTLQVLSKKLLLL